MSCEKKSLKNEKFEVIIYVLHALHIIRLGWPAHGKAQDKPKTKPNLGPVQEVGIFLRIGLVER